MHAWGDDRGGMGICRSGEGVRILPGCRGAGAEGRQVLEGRYGFWAHLGTNGSVVKRESPVLRVVVHLTGLGRWLMDTGPAAGGVVSRQLVPPLSRTCTSGSALESRLASRHGRTGTRNACQAQHPAVFCNPIPHSQDTGVRRCAPLLFSSFRGFIWAPWAYGILECGTSVSSGDLPSRPFCKCSKQRAGYPC